VRLILLAVYTGRRAGIGVELSGSFDRATEPQSRDRARRDRGEPGRVRFERLDRRIAPRIRVNGLLAVKPSRGSSKQGPPGSPETPFFKTLLRQTDADSYRRFAAPFKCDGVPQTRSFPVQHGSKTPSNHRAQLGGALSTV
jgi:hypothetical protein